MLARGGILGPPAWPSTVLAVRPGNISQRLRASARAWLRGSQRAELRSVTASVPWARRTVAHPHMALESVFSFVITKAVRMQNPTIPGAQGAWLVRLSGWEHCPTDRQVVSSIPSRGTHLGGGFDPLLGRVPRSGHV